MKAAPAQTSFNAGELSPRLEGRVDLAKYANGCRQLENFLPMVQGPAIKRSGTRYVKDVKDVAAVTRLVPFEFGTTQAYILEFGNLYVRVYAQSGGVLEAGIAITAVGATTPIRITAPAHGFVTGNQVFISGSTIPGINAGYFHITFVGVNQFDLNGTASLGAGGAGGTAARCYEFATLYTTADLEALQFAQSADVLYVAHPNHPQQKISRTGNTAWTITGAAGPPETGIVFDAPPFSQENVDPADYMVATGYTGAITVYSTGGHFLAGHVGGFVKLAESLEGAYPEWSQGADPIGANSAIGFYDIGNVNFGNGVNIYAQYQGRFYRFIANYGLNLSGGAPPVHEIGVQNDGVWDWEFVNHGYGWAVITAVTDAYTATATVVRELGQTVQSPQRSINAIANTTPIGITTAVAHLFTTGDTVFIRGTLLAGINNQTFVVTVTGAATFTLNGTAASGAFGAGGIAIRVKTALIAMASGVRSRREQCTRWAFGAFSIARGYPSSVAFFEDRLWWAGTASDPQGLWASRTGRYEDHLLTDEDDGALFLLLNTQQVNKIEWLSAGKVLAIGTAGGEFILSGATDGSITPGNAQASQHSFYGSRAATPPIRVENVTLFVQRSGRKLIEFAFDFNSDNYTGSDMTVLANHIPLGRIKKLAWAQEPDRIVWAVLDDGKLVAMTYDRKQEVFGWHRHIIGGASVAVESVAVIPHPDGDRDQVWLIVRRTVNGSVRRHVEYFEKTWLAGTVIDDGLFVDAGLTYDGAPATTITGLWHLLNTDVVILADGVWLAGTVSATGTITLSTAADTVHVGLQYIAKLETMRIEAGAADGTSQGKTKRITSVVVRLEDTGKSFHYGPDLDWYQIFDRELKTGDSDRLPWPSGYEKEGRVYLQHAQPTPCTIVAIFPTLETEDG